MFLNNNRNNIYKYHKFSQIIVKSFSQTSDCFKFRQLTPILNSCPQKSVSKSTRNQFNRQCFRDLHNYSSLKCYQKFPKNFIRNNVRLENQDNILT